MAPSAPFKRDIITVKDVLKVANAILSALTNMIMSRTIAKSPIVKIMAIALRI
jgi:hypothetical protein